MSEWATASIGSLISVSYPGEWGAAPDDAGLNVTVYRAADFNESGRLTKDSGVRRRLQSQKLLKVALKPGDILLEKSGGSPDQPVGRVTLFQGESAPAAASNFLQTLRPADAVDSTFLFYLLQHEYAAGRVMRYQQQTTGLINFRLKDYLKEAVRYPRSKDDQRDIAVLLSSLDEQIELTALLIEKSEALRAGVIKDALERCLGAPREPLAKLATVGSGITLGRKFSGPGTSDYPYLRVANVQDGHIDLTEVKTLRLPQSVAARAMLQPGDVLMNEGGDFDKLGRGAVWRGQIANCLHQNHVFRVRCNQELLLPDFLALWAASEFGKKFFMLASKQSTNLASINSTQLKKFPVLLPSPDEQRDVLRTVEAVNGVLELDRVELAGLRLLKQGLARDLLTGKVRVPS